MSSSSLPLSPRGAEEEGDTRSDGTGSGGGCEEGDTRSDGTRSYGEARYVEEGGASYGWYQRYAALRPFVCRLVPPASRLLMIGCGSVLMSEDMVADGYMEIINIDISLVLIEMMRKKYFDLPQLQYMQMDVRDMSKFSEESFDCAIVKGTLDSLMGSSNIWSLCLLIILVLLQHRGLVTSTVWCGGSSQRSADGYSNQGESLCWYAV
ncbi:hypothetical protein ZWY2020_016440 [Hordeum vulgare]|nr:hypothetical protein ZWY2020_016440 [Hordeum vulgare]